MKMHRLADVFGSVTACGRSPNKLHAVRFPGFMIEFIKRNPEFTPCRVCWPGRKDNGLRQEES